MIAALAGKRILIVEDEYFIANDLKRLLVSEGAEVIGPIGALDNGLSLATRTALDAVVLDVNLSGNQSYPIAEMLDARAIPYVFVTGYDEWSMREEYRNVPRIAKPFAPRDVLAAIDRAIAGAAR